MIIKIDLKKAYDRLEWCFVKETLSNVRLPQPMVERIMECVTNAKFHLMWSGECTEAIQQTQGI